MRFIKALWPLFAVAIVALTILILAEPVTKWVAARRALSNGMIIGHIIRAEGGVRRLHGADIELIPSLKKIDLRDGDRLQSSVDSKAIILLNSQDELEMGPGSAIQFQLWNPKDANSPLYVKWMLGTLTLRKPGIKGKAYIVKDGRLYLPGQKPSERAMALTVLRNAPLDLRLAEPGAKTEFDNDSVSGDETSAEDPAIKPGTMADPETLANEYIDEVVIAHQAQLQKCWLSRLKDVKADKGQIVVQFEISKRGKVKEARIADSSLPDEVLQKCVVSVFERIQFRPFKGSEISLSYPLNFE